MSLVKYTGSVAVTPKIIDFENYFSKENDKVWSDDLAFQFIVQHLDQRILQSKFSSSIIYEKYTLTPKAFGVTDDSIDAVVHEKILDLDNTFESQEILRRLIFSMNLIEESPECLNANGAPNIFFRMKSCKLQKPLTVYCRMGFGKWCFLAWHQPVWKGFGTRFSQGGSQENKL